MAGEEEMSRTRIFTATIARQADDGTWFLMNRQRGGWGSFAIPYLTLGDIEAEWQVRIGAAGQDFHSTFRHVVPIDEES